ncbi:hypothetical protein EV130_106179 [Rhizobium azibense]|uniref:Uncharacterized protein n=1 Tax=Rhizobium azibense TaxID=1136135 RepID=A0A4V6P1G7_9HYPH|nr:MULTISPECIES: hypothetical protein [Rhizobium]TCU24587.1 hypothetical protein EV130_106179 [Rhizobium azibense]TCU39335.1 hypothetical protein EV129_103181 [Rhizobium azibense]
MSRPLLIEIAVCTYPWGSLRAARIKPAAMALQTPVSAVRRVSQ